MVLDASAAVAGLLDDDAARDLASRESGVVPPCGPGAAVRRDTPPAVAQGGTMTAALNARLTLGKTLIALSALFTGVGAFVADFDETHLFNPSWPPHARFHDAQTMSLGTALAIATLTGLWRPVDTVAGARRRLDLTSGIAAMYWTSNLTALAFPTTRAVDPPREEAFPQWRAAFPCLALVVAGRALERRRLTSLPGT